MSISNFSIQSYRSVRNIYLPIDPISIYVGANGVGKTNLYKGLSLLRSAAEGSITYAIAEDGGLESVLWAGKRKDHKPVRLSLKADIDDFIYEIEIGLPQQFDGEVFEAAFQLEPMVKEERLIRREGRRDIALMERRGSLVTLRNEDGKRETHKNAILPSETVLACFRDAARYPELEIVRRELLEWRLYHDFRTDAASPIRQPCHAITTPTLSPDGRDLAAVLATLFVIRGDTVDLDRAIDDAFPGSTLTAGDEGSQCHLHLTFPDIPRPFGVQELSDGTLKYLCLLGALMGYRLPSLIALNEPEASLHPSLLPPLARLIARAARHTRVWIVTHSQELATALYEETGKKARHVIKRDGETLIEGLKLSGDFAEDDEP